MIDDETHVYLVMEYCRGGDLFKRLAVMGGCMEEGWVSSQACPCIHRKKNLSMGSWSLPGFNGTLGCR